MTSYDHRGCDGCDGWTLAFEDLKFSVPSRSCQHKLGAAGIATQEILQLAQVVISCGVENSDAIWQDAEWMIEIKTDILWVQQFSNPFPGNTLDQRLQVPSSSLKIPYDVLVPHWGDAYDHQKQSQQPSDTFGIWNLRRSSWKCLS